MHDNTRLEFFERILHMRPVFDRLCQVAESKLLQAAESGYQLQHHKVTKGKRARSWTIDAATLVALFGDEILEAATERPVLSPYQAEQKLGKSELKDYIRSVEGTNKIAPIASILGEVSINASEFN